MIGKSRRRGWPRHTASSPAETLHPGTGRPAGREARSLGSALRPENTQDSRVCRAKTEARFLGPAPRDPQPGIQERLAHRGPPMGLSARAMERRRERLRPCGSGWSLTEGGWESTTSPEARKRPRPKAGGPVLGAAEPLRNSRIRVRSAHVAPHLPQKAPPMPSPRPAAFAGSGWCQD